MTEPKARNWSQTQRAAARARAIRNKPWQHATGPKTSEGKRISSMNAYKHGAYTCHAREERKNIRALLKHIELEMLILKEIVKTWDRCEEKFSKNELSSKREKQATPNLYFRPEHLKYGPYSKTRPPRKREIDKLWTSNLSKISMLTAKQFCCAQT